jgi:hypothetical protein
VDQFDEGAVNRNNRLLAFARSDTNGHFERSEKSACDSKPAHYQGTACVAEPAAAMVMD